ncbi:MAG: alcohol dehydrogenase catalytic domain-containing protein [Anaerolineae bacterium]|nr:alcohol dehydrogenase catalytic domain-containing protein [Anaerolineae bacterium]
MKYLMCLEADEANVLEMPTPKVGPGELLVRLSACGVCATDTMKIYGDGYPKPQKLGHEIVGVVHALGEGVTQFAIGQRVGMAHHTPDYASHYSRRGSETMDPTFKKTNVHPGGFSEYILVPAINVQHLVVPVPDLVPDLRAIFMEPLACCLRALDRAPLREEQSALVVGIGAIGMLFVPLLRDKTVTTIVSDVRPERLALAQQWGATAGCIAGQEDVPATCKAHTEGRGVDVVILTALNQLTFDMALSAVRDGGTILIFGGKPGTELKMDMWKVFLREINLITSYSTTPALLPRAMSLLARADYPLEQLVSHTFSIDAAAQGFELVYKGQAGKVAVIA